MPGRTIDDRVPAYSNDFGPVEPGDLDLLGEMPQPCTFVQPGIATVMDGVTIMPTSFRYHHRLAVAAPSRQQHLYERRSRCVG
jgi:hypothetical protein